MIVIKKHSILRKSFSNRQEDLYNDHGNKAYAGHIGIAQGLKVINKTFKTESDTQEYVMEAAQKWGPAVAVKVGDFSAVFSVKAG